MNTFTPARQTQGQRSVSFWLFTLTAIAGIVIAFVGFELEAESHVGSCCLPKVCRDAAAITPLQSFEFRRSLTHPNLCEIPDSCIEMLRESDPEVPDDGKKSGGNSTSLPTTTETETTLPPPPTTTTSTLSQQPQTAQPHNGGDLVEHEYERSCGFTHNPNNRAGGCTDDTSASATVAYISTLMLSIVFLVYAVLRECCFRRGGFHKCGLCNDDNGGGGECTGTCADPNYPDGEFPSTIQLNVLPQHQCVPQDQKCAVFFLITVGHLFNMLLFAVAPVFALVSVSIALRDAVSLPEFIWTTMHFCPGLACNGFGRGMSCECHSSWKSVLYNGGCSELLKSQPVARLSFRSDTFNSTVVACFAVVLCQFAVAAFTLITNRCNSNGSYFNECCPRCDWAAMSDVVDPPRSGRIRHIARIDETGNSVSLLTLDTNNNNNGSNSRDEDQLHHPQHMSFNNPDLKHLEHILLGVGSPPQMQEVQDDNDGGDDDDDEVAEQQDPRDHLAPRSASSRNHNDDDDDDRDDNSALLQSQQQPTRRRRRVTYVVRRKVSNRNSSNTQQ